MVIEHGVKNENNMKTMNFQPDSVCYFYLKTNLNLLKYNLCNIVMLKAFRRCRLATFLADGKRIPL